MDHDVERMTTMEGAGTLLVICGIMLGLATLANTAMAGTFLPLAGLAIAAGVIVVKLARRRPR